LLSRNPFVFGFNVECLAIAAGVLALGSYLSRHFGKVRGQLPAPT